MSNGFFVNIVTLSTIIFFCFAGCSGTGSATSMQATIDAGVVKALAEQQTQAGAAPATPLPTATPTPRIPMFANASDGIQQWVVGEGPMGPGIYHFDCNYLGNVSVQLGKSPFTVSVESGDQVRRLSNGDLVTVGWCVVYGPESRPLPTPTSRISPTVAPPATPLPTATPTPRKIPTPVPTVTPSPSPLLAPTVISPLLLDPTATPWIPFTFEDGLWRINEDIPPGTYKSSGSESCYWMRLRGFSGSASDTLASGYGSSYQIVTIKPSDKGFNSNGCGYWVFSD